MSKSKVRHEEGIPTAISALKSAIRRPRASFRLVLRGAVLDTFLRYASRNMQATVLEIAVARAAPSTSLPGLIRRNMNIGSSITLRMPPPESPMLACLE